MSKRPHQQYDKSDLEIEELVNKQHSGMTKQNSDDLLKQFDAADYARLKRLEKKGLEEKRQMRNAPILTPEAIAAFINQLSPWNLKTTGVSILEAFAERYALQKATRARLDELKDMYHKVDIVSLHQNNHYDAQEAVEYRISELERQLGEA